MITKTTSKANKRISKIIRGYFLPVLVFCLSFILLAPVFSVQAQERVKSLSIRQFEIEEAIRNGLKYYLDPKDYVLRVKLFGEERAVSMANETLPGFGQLNSPSITSGAKYWQITRMRVDLVMHKEVSPSVNSYIGEIVPILSGLDYERGDELIFVPILPSEPFPEQLDRPAETDGLPVKSFNPPVRTLMGPGPSDVHPRILSAMARPTIGHISQHLI
jgi:hypothetical protein